MGEHTERNFMNELTVTMKHLPPQMQPYEKRGETLEKIIGNEFSVNCLTEEEKEFLYHFNQQGYKILWLLISTIKESKKTEFDDIKDRVNSKKATKSYIIFLYSLTDKCFLLFECDEIVILSSVLNTYCKPLKVYGICKNGRQTLSIFTSSKKQ